MSVATLLPCLVCRSRSTTPTRTKSKPSCNIHTVQNNPSRFHVKLWNPHWARCICEIPILYAKIRIIYELLIIMTIGVPQMQRSCADFGVCHVNMLNYFYSVLTAIQGQKKFNTVHKYTATISGSRVFTLVFFLPGFQK